MRQLRIARVLVTALAVGFLGGYPAQAAFLPNAPTNVVVTPSSPANTEVESGTITVSWTASVVDSSHDAPVYYIVKAKAGSTEKTTTVARSGSNTDYSTTLSGLTGGTSYAVTVAAYRQEGTATTTAVNVTAVTSPEPPGSLSTTVGRQSITLNWSAPTNNGGSAITGYLIRNDVSLETTTVSNPALTSTPIGNLQAGSTAKFSIRAINSNGSSPWVAFDQPTIPLPPDPPAKPEITNGERSITATWVEVTATSPVTGYKVYLRDMSKSAAETPTVTTLTSVTFESLTAGASYTVRVLATNIAGDGQLSETSSVKTLPAATQLASNTPVFNPTTLPNLVLGASQAFTVTSPSGETITVTAVGTPTDACTYNSNTRTVTAVALGTCTVTATASATTLFATGIANKVFTITKTLQTITFNQIANQPLPGPLTLTATTSASGLTVTYTASDNCTVSGSTLTFTGTGNCTVVAEQAGSTTVEAAQPVTRSFTITPASNSAPTNNSNSNSGGGSGGGGFGGGGFGGGGAVTPSEVETVTPTVVPTPPPLPPGPKPTPTPSPTPTDVSPTPTATPKPSQSPGKAAITTKTNTFAVATTAKVVGPVKSSTLSAATSTVAVKANTNFQPVLPTVKKGEKVTMVIKDAKGKSYTVASLTVAKAGSLKLPAVKFSQKGSYTITIKVGTKTKVVKINSTK